MSGRDGGDAAGRLAGVLDSVLGDLLTDRNVDIATHQLLPVVREIADQRAAEVLAEEAADWEATERVGSFAARLRARAAALRGEAGR